MSSGSGQVLKVKSENKENDHVVEKMGGGHGIAYLGKTENVDDENVFIALFFFKLNIGTSFRGNAA
jgi:hypothetical protein